VTKDNQFIEGKRRASGRINNLQQDVIKKSGTAFASLSLCR
jgi:hypothetical protein